MGKRIYVGNLPFTVTNDQLKEHFAACGAVESAEVIMDRFSGRSKGFGFVEMPNEKEADEAISKLNGQEFAGRALTVNEARPKEARNDRRGGGDGGRDRRGGGGGGGGEEFRKFRRW